jgi:CheY-like chemotaxis protein
MIVAAKPQDDKVLREVLSDEFPKLIFCNDQEKALDVFVDIAPAVLVLAFEHIEQAESFYLRLFRTREKAFIVKHQSIVLCDQREAEAIYKLCNRDIFDDYLIFRPLQDPFRLKLSISQAFKRRTEKQRAGHSNLALNDYKEEVEKLDSFLQGSMEEGRQLHNIDLQQLTNSLHERINRIRDDLVSGAMGDGVKVIDQSTARSQFNKLIETHVSSSPSAEQLKYSLAMKSWLDNVENGYKEKLTPVVNQVQTMTKEQSYILVVEDDEFTQGVYTHILQKAGYRVKIAEDVTKAMLVINNESPSLIFMDYILPGIDGLELTRTLQCDPENQNIPIVVSTGKNIGSILKESLRAGAVGFMVKPVTEKGVLEKINKYLE